jgi:hypothetical protein
MVKQISIFLENDSGKLAAIIAALSNKGIDLRAMTLSEAQDFGIVRLIVDDYEAASAALQDEEFIFSVKEVIAIELDDEPGSLAKVLKALGDNNINMEYTYAFTAHRKGAANLIIKAKEEDEAVAVLRKAGIKLMSQKDLLE